MDEYKYDELGMAFGFALFAVRQMANNPTEESYRGDGYYGSARGGTTLPATQARADSQQGQPSRSSLRRQVSKKDSARSAVSFGESPNTSQRFADTSEHEHYEIPDEDITTYTTEEMKAFDEFQKQKSAMVDFSCEYEEEDELYGENYDIPVYDGPAYTDDEILKFNLFQKAKSAQIQFDGVYHSDEEFEGENYNIPDEDAQEYTEQEAEELAHFQRATSAFVQFGVYDDVDEEGQSAKIASEKNPVFHTAPHAAVAKKLDHSEPEAEKSEKDNGSDESAGEGKCGAEDTSTSNCKSAADAPREGNIELDAIDCDITGTRESGVDYEGNEVDSTPSPQKVV